MVGESLVVTGMLLATVLAYAATPVAIRIAGRLNFYDKPAGYKGHAAPTPYLGGAAVVAAFAIAALLVADRPDRTVPLVVAMVVLWGVGTVDDRRNLSPWLRLAVEGAIAGAFWGLGLGWDFQLGPVVDLVATIVWVVAVVNAFNLFDNMDGAAGTMAAVAAAGLGGLGVVIGEAWLTISAAALCGACIGFLPHNLSSPAKIFLGDGGSMPVGFGIAALAMIGCSDAATAFQALAMGLLFVGIPAIDTALVMISRHRRGVSLLSGGRDHLTHRTQQRLRTARAVSVSLGAAQALLAALALMTFGGGSGALVGAVAVFLAVAITLIAVLDSGYERTAFEPAAGVGAVAASRRSWTHGPVPGPAWVLVPLALASGLSSLASGFYDSSVWAPIGLGLLALGVAVALALPARLSRPMLLAGGGLVALAGWALASRAWAPSPEAASLDANRTVVLTVFFVVACLLVRDRRLAVWALAAATAGALVVAAWVLGEMTFGGARELFVGGRLNRPLGYINGQGCVFALALFPALAVAERARSRAVAGTGAGVVALLAGLALLSQSRGVAIGATLAIGVLLAVVPGRLRRLGALAVAALGVAVASSTLLDVHAAGFDGRAVPDGTARSAALVLLGASLAAGVAWALLTGLVVGPTAGRVRRGATAGLVVAAALLAVGVAAKAPTIARKVSDQADRFSTPAQAPGGVASLSPATRFGSTDSNRYEYWRVAWRAFRDDPVAGVGAGGYPVPYFRLRTSTEDVRQPHSLPLQVLAELGGVGILALLAFVGGVGWGFTRLARRPEEAGLAVAAGGTAVAWLGTTAVDWIHLLPGVTGVALVAGAVLVRPLGPSPREERAALPAAPRGRLGRLALTAVAVVGLSLAVLSLSREVLTEHFRDQAREALARNPQQALTSSARALRLDGASVSALITRSGALARVGDASGSRDALRTAVRREPESFVAHTLLGDAEARLGDRVAARAQYRIALSLNPRDRTVQELARG